MDLAFQVDQWAAWAPGLTSQDAWRQWLAAPCALPADAPSTPALTEMPAMMRRRVERLGRLALQAAYWCDPAPGSVIFASRYGDVTRSVSLLKTLAAAEGLSPTAFSMSVHNAIGALFSIARGDMGHYTAMAAGAETVEAAFFEALAQLADGTPSVMVVVYDESLPEPYDAFEDGPNFPRAWACRLSLATGEGAISLRPDTVDAGHGLDSAPPSVLPRDLEVLRFLVNGEARLQSRMGDRVWLWHRGMPGA